jgi:hypothetical protein
MEEPKSIWVWKTNESYNASGNWALPCSLQVQRLVGWNCFCARMHSELSDDGSCNCSKQRNRSHLVSSARMFCHACLGAEVCFRVIWSILWVSLH